MKQIKVSDKNLKLLAEKLGFTTDFCAKALRFETNSFKAQKVRLYAEKKFKGKLVGAKKKTVYTAIAKGPDNYGYKEGSIISTSKQPTCINRKLVVVYLTKKQFEETLLGYEYTLKKRIDLI